MQVVGKARRQFLVELLLQERATQLSQHTCIGQPSLTDSQHGPSLPVVVGGTR
jgi:hypothetical protein